MLGYITVAASNSTAGAKSQADFVCTGENDGILLQNALDKCADEDKNLYLLNGRYCIDSFAEYDDGGVPCALRIPIRHREIRIIGQNHEYGFQKSFDNGVVLYVSKKALDSIKDSADVIRSQWTRRGIQNGQSVCIENVSVFLADNAHSVQCVDFRRCDRVEVKNMTIVGYADLISEDSKVGLNEVSPVPNKACIGLTMTDGSNYNYSNYTNVFTYGMGVGFRVGGEHVVMTNCGAARGIYGYTFGDYEIGCGSNHPITLINCFDEGNINLPYFGRWCGDGDGKGGRLTGGQEVKFISFNIERFPATTPGGVLGDLMREEVPGSYCGTIEFTAQPKWCCRNTADFRMWENDGSGKGIRTRNCVHKDLCTTEERMSYYPNLGQQIFDTDIGKLLICTDPEKRIWVDAMGNKC